VPPFYTYLLFVLALSALGAIVQNRTLALQGVTFQATAVAALAPRPRADAAG